MFLGLGYVIICYDNLLLNAVPLIFSKIAFSIKPDRFSSVRLSRFKSIFLESYSESSFTSVWTYFIVINILVILKL